jgi:transcriptional regulator with XRE-family HTH domain
MSGSDHQPTSASVNAVGPELRRLRRERGETQRAVAEAIGVSRANLTQWETGKYLPSPANARALDDYFGAGSTIVTLVSSGHAPAADTATGPSLLEVFHRVGASLRDAIGPDAKGRPGWQQNLQQDRLPSVLSTAYGIKAMVVVDEPYVDLDALADSLLKMLDDTEVWNADPESLRPEIVATVVDALFRVGTPMPVEDALLRLEASLDDDFARNRPYLLATALQTVTRLRPDAPLADRLIDDLLATRQDDRGALVWPEKREPGLALVEPSTVHTARAVVALRDVLRNRNRDRSDLTDAVDQATRWLVDRTEPDHGVAEDLARPDAGDQSEIRISIRHFTAAWVVQALSLATEPVPAYRLRAPLDLLWGRYDHEVGLWRWGNGDLPIWMTLDAITALRTAALTLAAPPVRPVLEGN